jgi:hypothetical protein
MKSITLSWTKSEKSIDKINKDLNKVLSKYDFRIATHNQSTVKGRMIITLFLEDKPGKVRAKCFRDQYYKTLDNNVNSFIEQRKVKYVTQSFIGSNIYTIVYYEATKEEIEEESFEEDIEVSVDIDGLNLENQNNDSSDDLDENDE